MKPITPTGTPITMDYETKNELMNDALFILDQGWNILIEQCSKVGASIILHNFHMGNSLLIPSILRQGKTILATSEKIWEQMREAFMENPIAHQHIEVVLFNPEEEQLFGLK